MSEMKHVSQKRLIRETSLKEKIIDTITKWEFILVVLFIGVVVVFSNLSPYFLDYFNLMNTTFNFMEKAIMALPMIFVIMCGDIDISVASILALCSFAMGHAAVQGAGTPELILIGLAVGIACGIFNGLLITSLKIPAIAVTLGSQSLFRGISQALLEDQAYTDYPESFAYFGQGYVGESLVPFELALFLVLAAIMGFILHKTTYGRKVYAIGNSSTAARFSGVPVSRIRFINMVLNGLFCGDRRRPADFPDRKHTSQYRHRMGYGSHYPGCSGWSLHFRRQGKYFRCYRRRLPSGLPEVRYGTYESFGQVHDHHHGLPADSRRSYPRNAEQYQSKA